MQNRELNFSSENCTAIFESATFEKVKQFRDDLKLALHSNVDSTNIQSVPFFNKVAADFRTMASFINHANRSTNGNRLHRIVYVTAFPNRNFVVGNATKAINQIIRSRNLLAMHSKVQIEMYVVKS